MLKNDTLENGTFRAGLYGSIAPRYRTDEHRNAITLLAMERWKKGRFKRAIKELKGTPVEKSNAQMKEREK